MKLPEIIFENEKFKSYDSITKYIIISSPHFLDKIDLNKMSTDDKTLVEQSIEYALEIIKNNKKQDYSILKKYFVKYPDSSLSIMKNINYQKKNNDIFNQNYESLLLSYLEEIKNSNKSK